MCAIDSLHVPTLVPMSMRRRAQEHQRLRAVPGGTCLNPNEPTSRGGTCSAADETADDVAVSSIDGGSDTRTGGSDTSLPMTGLAVPGEPGSDGTCEYASVPPTPGTFVVFPGWLLHAVLPAARPTAAAAAAKDCRSSNNSNSNHGGDNGDGEAEAGAGRGESGSTEGALRLPRMSVAFNYGTVL